MTYNKETSPIKIERIAARIDEPNPASNKITGYVGENATEAEKRAMANALDKVKELKQTRYAISNLANQSYIMQKWADATTLTIPSGTGFTYYNPAAEFGSEKKFENADRFTAATAAFAHKDYVFENNSSTSPSTMYFEYKVTLKDMTNADFLRMAHSIVTTTLSIRVLQIFSKLTRMLQVSSRVRQLTS